MAPILILCTDDPRLIRKAEHYAGEYGANLQIYPANVEVSFDEIRAKYSLQTEQYCFLDLDAKEFDVYSLTSLIQSAFPAAVCIAFTLTPDPSVVQKTKLCGIPTLLQRFQFEDLLKKMCAEAGTL